MIARAELAVLDFNCGVRVGQDKTQSGKLRFKQQYSKVTQSWVVKQICEPKDGVYIQHLMDEEFRIPMKNMNYQSLRTFQKPLLRSRSLTKSKLLKTYALAFLSKPYLF